MNSKSIKFLFILYTSICVEWSSTSWRDFRWFLLLWWSTFTWFRAEKFIAVQYIGLQYVVLKEKGPRKLSYFFRLDYMVGCHSVPYLSVPYPSVPGRNGIFVETVGRNDSFFFLISVYSRKGKNLHNIVVSEWCCKWIALIKEIC